MAVGLGVYVLSRMCVMAGAMVRASQLAVDARTDGEPEQSALTTLTQVLTSWDGRWYLELVRTGYPDSIPADVTFDDLEARAAFFPMYPGAVRLVDTVLPGGDTFAALFVNFVLGAISVVMIGILARQVFPDGVAARAMTIYAIFPGSFVLSFAYSEALLIVFAAACLLLLMDEQWLLAGFAGAIATATRPNGIAVVLACLVAALPVVWRRREWRPLLAVAIAPLGFVAFQLYVDDVAGERGAWFRVQREAWDEGTSFGWTAVESVREFFSDPFQSPAPGLTVVSLIVLGFMGWCAWKVRLPLPWVAYSAVIVALMLVPETVTARPRFVFTAFPLFIAVAAWWPERVRTVRTTRGGGDHVERSTSEDDRASIDRVGWDAAILLCGAGLVTLTALYAVLGAIP